MLDRACRLVFAGLDDLRLILFVMCDLSFRVADNF